MTHSDLNRLDLEQLAAYCAEQTQKFLKRLANETRYCFELIRRGYVEQSNDALHHVYRIYMPLLVSRAHRHKWFERSCQDAEYFARVALANFYRRCRGSQFAEMFADLPSVMGYLYACLHSAIVQDIRDNRMAASLPEDIPAPGGDKAGKGDLNGSELWAAICRALADPDDERLAYLRLVLDVRPAEIVRLEPHKWKTEREVSVALQRIRRRLRKDPGLRNLAGFDDAET